MDLNARTVAALSLPAGKTDARSSSIPISTASATACAPAPATK